MPSRHKVILGITIVLSLITGCTQATPTTVPETATVSHTQTSIPPTARSTQTPAATATPEASSSPSPTGTPDVPFEKVSFTTRDGVDIAATLFGEGEIALLLLHMGAGNASQRSWQPFARLIADMGYSALTVDFRGMGESGGSLVINDLIKDAHAALEFLRERGYERVICVGASMGGTTCLRLALDTTLDGVVVLSSTMSLGPENKVTEEELAQLAIPKLFIYGNGDTFVPTTMSLMHKSAAQPKLLIEYESSAHGTDLFLTDHGDHLRQELLAFIEEVRANPQVAAPEPTRTPSVEKIRDLPYVTEADADQVLDVYLPTGPGGPFPTLLVIHGGGADKTSLSSLAMRFVKLEYAVVSIDHREWPDHEYPAPVQDAFCALAWMHANADAYSFDPARIYALGHSSGGTLAAMLGVVDDPGIYIENCPHALPAADWVQGIVTFTGIFDYASAASGDLEYYVNSYLGAEKGAAPDIWAEASPITWVDGNEQPFLVIHGEADQNIPPEQSTSFAAALEGAGVDVELLLIPDASHMAIISSETAYQVVEAFLGALASP